ncbi:hypothetical protein Esti_003602 [Eimeria stiedai]
MKSHSISLNCKKKPPLRSYCVAARGLQLSRSLSLLRLEALLPPILIVVSALATNGFFVPAATLAADALAPSSGASTNAFVQQSLSWTDLLAKALKPNAEPTVFPPPTSQESEHWDERIERIFFCLLLSSKHLNLHQAVYRQVVDVKSPKLGMRQDDLYGLLLHSIWSSCYYKSLSHSVASLYHLSSARAATLTSPAEIPAKFSYQLLQDIDLTIKYFAETQFSAGGLSFPFLADYELERFLVLCWVVDFAAFLSSFCFDKENRESV